jgi:hypothetical protein
VARGDDAALEMLLSYAPRYARVAARAGLELPALRPGDIDVVECVTGTMTTDFGAPDVVTSADRQPLDAAAARRVASLLSAAWDELDAVVAVTPASLRKGPRGGGRDRDKMLAHVFEAERAYARKVGVRVTPQEWRDVGAPLLRAQILDVVSRPSDGAPPVERGWPARYYARRTAWHAIDHAWEMEDRST